MGPSIEVIEKDDGTVEVRIHKNLIKGGESISGIEGDWLVMSFANSLSVLAELQRFISYKCDIHVRNHPLF